MWCKANGSKVQMCCVGILLGQKCGRCQTNQGQDSTFTKIQSEGTTTRSSIHLGKAEKSKSEVYEQQQKCSCFENTTIPVDGYCDHRIQQHAP